MDLPTLLSKININMAIHSQYTISTGQANWVWHIEEVSRPHQSFIEQIDYKANTSFDMEKLNWSIRHACSKRRIVLVNNLLIPHANTFDLEGVFKVYNANGIVEWQGKVFQ